MVKASQRIRAVSPEPPLLAHTSSESRGQKARSLAPLNGWTCAVTICHDGMLEDTNSLDGAHLNFFPADVNFKSQLDEASLVKAKEELGESEKDRVNGVQAFRNLILQDKWLRTPTGIFASLPNIVESGANIFCHD